MIRVGPLLDAAQLSSKKDGAFDLIFIDADKSGYPNYFEWP